VLQDHLRRVGIRETRHTRESGYPGEIAGAARAVALQRGVFVIRASELRALGTAAPKAEAVKGPRARLSEWLAETGQTRVR
jgi:hypothetical protein